MSTEPEQAEATTPGPVSRAAHFARVLAGTARNAAEVVRFGSLDTGEETSPFTIETEQYHFRLRHYFADDVPTDAPPILLVPPLMIRADIWDVSPTSSAVSSLHESGLDVWVVDFGDPVHEPGGAERTLTDHVIAVSNAVDRVCAATGRDVVLSGYSQGGMFCYQAAAYRRGKALDSLVTFGSPVDSKAPLPLPLSPEFTAKIVDSLLESGLLRFITLPGWASRTGFRMLTPVKSIQNRAKFMLALRDRESLLPREGQRRFLEVDGFTAWSGPAIAELLELFVTHNRMIAGGIVITDRLVTLADIDVPILTVVGTNDTLGHPDSVRAIRRAAPRADVHELTLKAGHFGLVVGSTARSDTWPAVAAWVNWRANGSALPENIVPADQVELSSKSVSAAGNTALTEITELGLGAGLFALGTARHGIKVALGLLSEAPAQLPRLARIEHLDPATPISLGLLLAEQARKSPDNVAFLFGDRAYRQRELADRLDSVVKGLISVGIHHGDRVGVLMDTRPSAFSVVAALSRLGATAVLLRPGADLRVEARLSGISWVVSDPENMDGRGAIGESVTWCVLGGGAEERRLDPDIIDMERIDPDEVQLPGWYRPNPHRAGDLAFVMFTGSGQETKTINITNHRWALSALGTAASASLKPGDTVYSTTPIHHTSAMLMTVGGAIAGGARFAMATSDDPATFWDEVRRYGATHVSYTWTSLRSVAFGPENPGEQHHPIRIFMGSGMPANLWRRVSERFLTARVLEFYAAADGDAILSNVQGVRIGSMGRPLPGTAEVRVAAFDQTTRKLEIGSDGLGRECLTDEVGLLLAKLPPLRPTDGPNLPLRGIFEPEDSWRSTGDLFHRDSRGDFWLVDAVSALITTEQGTIAPSVVRNALGTVPAVELCVAYGVNSGGDALLVAATTVRSGMTITALDLDHAFDRLPMSQRPDFVQVVPTIDVTAWHRPVWTKLQKAGVPKPTRKRLVWRLDRESATYQSVSHLDKGER